MRDRLLGILLFLPVPAVLWLFTRQPLGVMTSIALGVVLMATHRLYARPFALRRAARRCLWCGGAVAWSPAQTGQALRPQIPDEAPAPLELREPRGITTWRTCGPLHQERLLRTLGWAGRNSGLLRIGILGVLGIFIAALLLARAAPLGPVCTEDAVAFFRLGIAVIVLPLGWLGPSLGARATRETQVPFPVHIQALIGTFSVLWLFRVIGLLWLGQGIAHLLRRIVWMV